MFPELSTATPWGWFNVAWVAGPPSPQICPVPPWQPSSGNGIDVASGNSPAGAGHRRHTSKPVVPGVNNVKVARAVSAQPLGEIELCLAGQPPVSA
jgi:hypothetical protein